MATVIDTLATDIEQVSQTVPDYYLKGKTLLSQFENVTKLGANRKPAIVAFKHYTGGVQSRVNLNGGSLTNGTGPKADKFTCGWLSSVISFQITREQYSIGTQGDNVARMNVFADIVANAMQAAISYDERDLFGDGSGVLTNSATALSTVTVSNDTLTFDSATDYKNVNLLWEGASVDVWDTTLATKRADGPYQITKLDPANKKVTLANSSGAAPTSMASTDRLTVVGLDNFTPATPTTGSSTWPAGGTTSSTGFTGDSWRHGSGYVNANTGYYFTKDRSTNPILAASAINADSNPISMWHFELAKTAIIQRFGDDAWMNMRWVMHHSNMLQLKQNVQTTSQWNRGGSPGGEKMPDQVPNDKYGAFFNVADMPAFSHKMASRDRADGYIPSDWIRVELEPTQWLKTPGSSSYVSEDRDTSGNQVLSYHMRLIQAFDWACQRPGVPAYIHSITPPTTPY